MPSNKLAHHWIGCLHSEFQPGSNHNHDNIRDNDYNHCNFAGDDYTIMSIRFLD
jgi:hypothetical protein